MTKFVLWKNIKPGQKVDDGYGGYETAPSEPGSYRLVQWADENNQHIWFEWEREAKPHKPFDYPTQLHPCAGCKWEDSLYVGCRMCSRNECDRSDLWEAT